jgi:hypothetical protein
MAEMEVLISGPLARALEAGRPRYNALFAQARRSLPALDAATFAAHLRGTVAPIVDEVARVAPGRVEAVVDVLYEFSLELLGKALWGRHPVLDEGWRSLLGGLPRHLAAAPRQFAGSVTNALIHLEQAPAARPGWWIADMRRLGETGPDVAALLEAGEVAAWRAGLAHYRDGALEMCARLDPPLARTALGLAEDGGPPLETIVRRLRDDPWVHPAAVGETKEDRPLRIMARVGGFRGFGGPFLTPPTVTYVEGQFFVSDQESCWQLTADLFGATLHRLGAAAPTGPDAVRSAFRITRSGKVSRGRTSRVFDELQGFTSAAGDASTLAVTVAWSHRVYLLAAPLVPPGTFAAGDG